MSRIRLTVCLVPLVLTIAAFMWCFALDTVTSRKITNWKINRIAERARNDPQDSRFVKQLIAMTRSRNSFTACTATQALGTLGDAARPVILDIAKLMDSSNMCVSQEAAKALERLGHLSEPALPHLISRIKKEPRDATAWFAIQAVGEIGRPAVKVLPLLRSLQGSEPKMFEGTVKQTIRRLESAVQEDKQRLMEKVGTL